jgi:hypothetical protein
MSAARQVSLAVGRVRIGPWTVQVASRGLADPDADCPGGYLGLALAGSRGRVPFTAVLTGPERTTRDNHEAASTCALPIVAGDRSGRTGFGAGGAGSILNPVVNHGFLVSAPAGAAPEGQAVRISVSR